jgi:putative membrane protein
MRTSRLQFLIAGGLVGAMGLGTAWAEQNPAPVERPTPVNTAAGNGNPGDVSGTTTSGNPRVPGVNSDSRVLGTPMRDDPTTNAATAGPTADADFIKRVHEANQKEIAMARMASEKAESAKVKSYATKVINDHEAADKRLMAYAERKAPDVKAEGRSTGAQVADQSHDRLSNLSGSDFDKEFVNLMVEEHDKALDLLKSARESASDKQLRAIYDGMVPKIEAHKRMARDLADKVIKS